MALPLVSWTVELEACGQHGKRAKNGMHNNVDESRPGCALLLQLQQGAHEALSHFQCNGLGAAT